VSLDKLQSLGGIRVKEEVELKKLIVEGFLRLENNQYMLTDSGFLSADRLASVMFRI
jgi:hypothetical protein